MTSEAIVIGGVEVPPGERARIEIPVVRWYTHGDVALPVRVVHGRKPGPRLFVCAAIHGDEINGVEIIRRLLRRKILRSIRGALIAVPVVNVHGFISHSRYLPDRRDLNREFPGSPRGSLAGRLAHTFMEEIVAQATHGIDLHTGTHHRTNLPQIRARLDDPETERLARAFGTPVIIDANLRDGSLRQAVMESEKPMLLFEGGEAMRFHEFSIRAGVRGILNVMRAIGMLSASTRASQSEPYVARSTTWIRAPESGILHATTALGVPVERGDELARISDPLGEGETRVKSRTSGLVIGRTNLPLANEGDPLYHIATFEEPEAVAGSVEAYQDEFEDEPE